MAVSGSMEESKDSINVPKAPARKKSSHNSVVHHKRGKFEADDRERQNSLESRPHHNLHKNNMINKDMIMQKNPSKTDKDDYEDEGSDLNWRPLRDFF